MKNEIMKCLICGEELYSEIGNGCKMCGMPLENENEEFCSQSCRIKYNNINKLIQLNIRRKYEQNKTYN